MTTQTLTKPDTRCILLDTCQFFQQVSGTGEGKGDRERTRRTKDGCATIEWNANSFSISIWTDQLLDKIQESWTWPGRKCYHRMTGRAKSWFYAHTHAHTLICQSSYLRMYREMTRHLHLFLKYPVKNSWRGGWWGRGVTRTAHVADGRGATLSPRGSFTLSRTSHSTSMDIWNFLRL